jgi:AraC-like DNA-binding protein
MTFVDYLTRLRIEKSKYILLDPNKRISEIAYEVGFESLTQFNRSFKKLSGQTPTQYRKTV